MNKSPINLSDLLKSLNKCENKYGDIPVIFVYNNDTICDINLMYVIDETHVVSENKNNSNKSRYNLYIDLRNALDKYTTSEEEDSNENQ